MPVGGLDELETMGQPMSGVRVDFLNNHPERLELANEQRNVASGGALLARMAAIGIIGT